jgi:uncharacterized membrane protein YdcZ (DUF606 family)
MAGALGTIIGPVLGGALCDNFGFTITCDILATTAVILGTLYFLVGILPYLIQRK